MDYVPLELRVLGEFFSAHEVEFSINMTKVGLYLGMDSNGYFLDLKNFKIGLHNYITDGLKKHNIRYYFQHDKYRRFYVSSNVIQYADIGPFRQHVLKESKPVLMVHQEDAVFLAMSA